MTNYDKQFVHHTFSRSDDSNASVEHDATNQQLPSRPCVMSWVLIPSTNKRGESGPQISCGKTYKLSSQQIPWGRVIFGGYNFASFKGLLLKLIQATILDSRNMLD